MTSNTASNSQNASININQPLHYFTGKIRAFWKNLVFFSDPRNVAVAEVRDVYFNGKRASYRDLGYLEELVQRSNWSGGGPELHSYVFDYHSEILCPWPHELSGKRLWKAKCAWFGFVPNGIKEDFLNNIVYMPLSYYTGTIKEFYDDKILFGDARNSVMVSLDNFYGGRGGYSTNTYRDSSWPLNDTIHAYIIKLDVLSDSRLIGPEPHLPTWPKGHFSPDMWVAKFAWQGDVPELVKDQVERFYIIRMNRWVDLHSVPWIVEDYEQNNIDNYSTLQENSSPEEKGNVQETETGALKSFIPVEQKPGLMKGSLLLADENEGLMTSFVDLIAFNKESFYINGKKFIHNYDLSYFFQDHIIALTAWVIPLDKPKVIFNIKVVWQAVCVWCGIPPKHLENIKKRYICEKVCNNSLKTSDSVSFIHFIGKVKSLSYASGVLISRAGLDQQVKISFKRKAVYIHGCKFHSSCSLLDKQQLLENSVWSVLAYPVWTDDAVGVPHYRALAMWHYDDQHCMNLLFKTISDFVDLVPALQNTKLGEARNYTEGKKLCQNISGWIAKVTENYGIIQSGSALVDATYLYFKKDVLYIDGELLPKGGSLQSLKQGRQCNVQANIIPPRDIDGYQVTMEATLVWIGRKPSFESSGEIAPQSSPSSPSHVLSNDTANDGKPSVAKTKAESCVRADKILRAAEGVMVGDVLMADEEHGLIISSDIIIGFSRDIFYINGNKFKEKDSSLEKFCSDRKITVRAMIVTLREPKVLLNCFVMCEAVCVWIGQEPDDLAVLQKVCGHEKQYKAIDFSKMSHRSLLYFMGRMTPVSKDVTLLASTTPEGTAKIFMSKENLFINGASVHQNDIFEQCKRKSQNWCVFAVPMPPRDMNGHSVKFTAVAVWDTSYHHKMRTVLLSAAYSLDKSSEKECSAEHDRACMKNKANGVSDNRKIEDITKALSNTLGLGGQRKDHITSLKMSSQLKDSSVIVSHLAKTPPEIEGCDTFKLGDSISEQEFCGKHVAGYIIKKTEGGGIAQWKSLQFEGFVFIEFSRKSLYLDMKPMTNKWKIADVKARPCNLYVIPVPHHNVEKCIVSLKATCGWIGKKPLHFPSPGTQLLPKIDLSSVHVTQAIEVEDTSEDEFDVHDDIDDGGLDVEIPLEGYQNDNIVNTRVTSGVSLKSELSQSLTAAEGNIAKGTQNEQLSNVICGTQSQAPPLKPQLKNKIENKSKDIRENKDNKSHKSGTIAEVLLSVGQLKGDDGSLHYFNRDICYLYGVSLGNVELWHVLAQDHPVHYSETELVPGMVKVQRVWIGFYDQPSREIAAEHIFAWCREKSVPGGARDILVSQLEAS